MAFPIGRWRCHLSHSLRSGTLLRQVTTPATTTGGKDFLPRLISRVVVRQFVIAAILFGPAETLDFWQGWVYLALLSLIPLSFIVYFSWRDPQLVERRMLHKETVAEQKYIIALWR